MSVYFAPLCVRLCGRGGADHRTGPLGRGGDVRDPARVGPHQRAPQAAALRLHCQRRSSPGLNTHTHCQHDKNKPLCLAYRSLTWRLQSPPQATFLRTAEYLRFAAAHSRRPSPCVYLFVRSRWRRWRAGPLALVAFVPVRLASHGRPSEPLQKLFSAAYVTLEAVGRLRLYERLFSSSAQFRVSFHCRRLSLSTSSQLQRSRHKLYFDFFSIL